MQKLYLALEDGVEKEYRIFRVEDEKSGPVFGPFTSFKVDGDGIKGMVDGQEEPAASFEIVDDNLYYNCLYYAYWRVSGWRPEYAERLEAYETTKSIGGGY